MTDTQEDKLSMYYAVIAAADKHCDAISAYHAELVKPQQAIQERKAVTAALKSTFAAADDVLKNRLYKLVPILALTHADFATDWWNSRNIYDWGRPSVGGGPQIPQTSSESSEDESSSEESESSESSEDSPSSESSLSSETSMSESSSEESSSEWISSESSEV